MLNQKTQSIISRREVGHYTTQLTPRGTRNPPRRWVETLREVYENIIGDRSVDLSKYMAVRKLL